MDTKIVLGGFVLLLFMLFYLFYLLRNSRFLNIFLKLYCVFTSVFLLFSTYYYNFLNKYHWFDPYYQVSPPEFQVSHEKDTNEFRILTLGGSTTRDPRKNENENYPAILEQLLKDKFPNKKITVLNGGMNWFCSKHSLMNYTEYGRLFHPDLVIVMDGINDLYRSFTPREFALGAFHPSYKHFYGASINGARSQTIESKLFLPELNDYKGYKEIEYPFANFLSFGSFKAFEKTLSFYIIADSAKCILMSQPSLYNKKLENSEMGTLWFGKYLCNMNDSLGKVYPSTLSMKTALDSFNFAVREIADKGDSYFFNADSIIPKNSTYFYDDVHYTNSGATLLGKSLYDYIVKNNIVE